MESFDKWEEYKFEKWVFIFWRSRKKLDRVKPGADTIRDLGVTSGSQILLLTPI